MFWFVPLFFNNVSLLHNRKKKKMVVSFKKTMIPKFANIENVEMDVSITRNSSSIGVQADGGLFIDQEVKYYYLLIGIIRHIYL